MKTMRSDVESAQSGRNHEKRSVRIAAVSSGVLLLSAGLSLLAALLYDATKVVRLIGLEPAGNEAIVVLVGLALVGSAMSVGVRCLRHPHSVRDGRREA